MSNMDPAAVAKAFNAARNAGDLEAAMGLVADDAVFVAEPPPPGRAAIHRGKGEIRSMVADQLGGNYHVEASNYQVTGDRVTFHSRVSHDLFTRLGLETVDGTGDMTIQDGLIRAYTYRFSPEAVSSMQKAMATVGR